jgi:hypothetical protein
MEKIPWESLSQILTFYGTRNFSTVFTRAHHWSLSWAIWIQSTLHNLLLQDPFSYYPPIYAQVLPVVSVTSSSQTRSVHEFLISHLRATRPATSPRLISLPTIQKSYNTINVCNMKISDSKIKIPVRVFTELPTWAKIDIDNKILHIKQLRLKYRL